MSMGGAQRLDLRVENYLADAERHARRERAKWSLKRSGRRPGSLAFCTRQRRAMKHAGTVGLSPAAIRAKA